MSNINRPPVKRKRSGVSPLEVLFGGLLVGAGVIIVIVGLLWNVIWSAVLAWNIYLVFTEPVNGWNVFFIVLSVFFLVAALIQLMKPKP